MSEKEHISGSVEYDEGQDCMVFRITMTCHARSPVLSIPGSAGRAENGESGFDPLALEYAIGVFRDLIRHISPVGVFVPREAD